MAAGALQEWRRRIAHFVLRSADSGWQLDLFLVCGVVTVICIRAYLSLTGYPQIGNGVLHISHAIFGAFMMAIALVVAIAFLPPRTRTFAAFLGGVGFGFFIDELGKFITRDVNYFFQPTIALIYITFIVMYLGFRAIGRLSPSPDEATLNALEALKAATIGELTEPRRRATLARLDEAEATGVIPTHIRELLTSVPELPDPRPNRVERVAQAMRDRYRALARRPWFARVLTVWFACYAAAVVIVMVALSFDHGAIRGFVEWAVTLSSIASGLLVVVGLLRLRDDRLSAYRWFERAVLVQIFVTQVFEFDQEQVVGVIGLAVHLLIWSALHTMIRAESEDQLVEPRAVTS